MPEVGMRAPVIDSLSPAQVLAGSGDNVVAVLGQNFRSPAQVLFGPTDGSIDKELGSVTTERTG
jgi:hypothetical protein